HSYEEPMNSFLSNSTGYLYKNVAKKMLFRRDPELVHVRATALGERMGGSGLAKKTIAAIFRFEDPALRQNIFGIEFANPLGLAAGFDYEARLTQVLPSMGFGF